MICLAEIMQVEKRWIMYKIEDRGSGKRRQGTAEIQRGENNKNIKLGKDAADEKK